MFKCAGTGQIRSVGYRGPGECAQNFGHSRGNSNTKVVDAKQQNSRALASLHYIVGGGVKT